MKARMMWSVLAASTVMLVAGTAFSGGGVTTDNELVDFNQATGELLAYPKNEPLATYLHLPDTHHVLADLGRFAPPDPCRELAHTWNQVVRYDAHKGVQSNFVFEILLTLMSDYQCRATVTSNGPPTPNNPVPIVSIAPTAK
jgi:hypothetical protein